jgi:tetratricopeptide (TPR) repeat protein
LRDFINREERAAKKSPLLAKHYLFLASAYQRQNKFGPAKAMALKSLRLMESYVASDSPELISIVIKIGQLSEVLGQYDEAARFYKRALLICQKDSGLESPALVPILTDLGQAYFESGNIREAEPIFLRALKIADKSMAKDEPAKDWILAGLMSIRISQKRYKDAETLAKQLLDRREKRASSTHAGSEYHYPLEGYVVVSLAALAHVYTLEGRDSDATPLLERAVALHEKAFAESVDQTGELDVLNQLALNYRKLGRKEEASKLESYSEKIKSKLNQNNAR